MATSNDQFPEEILGRLAAYDEQLIESTLGISLLGPDSEVLSSKASALVRIAALIGTGAGVTAYQWAVGLAVRAGATVEDVIGVVVAVAPAVGVARVVAAAPALAQALGYDVDAALERPED